MSKRTSIPKSTPPFQAIVYPPDALEKEAKRLFAYSDVWWYYSPTDATHALKGDRIAVIPFDAENRMDYSKAAICQLSPKVAAEMKEVGITLDDEEFYD